MLITNMTLVKLQCERNCVHRVSKFKVVLYIGCSTQGEIFAKISKITKVTFGIGLRDLDNRIRRVLISRIAKEMVVTLK